MRKRLAVLGSIAFTVLMIWITANTIIKMGGQAELQHAFAQAVSRSDAAAVRAISLDSEAARIWDTLQTAQIDKAERIATREAGFSVMPFAQAIAYLDLTAEHSNGRAVPFRLELVRGGIFFPGEWRISAIRLDAKN